MYSLFAISHHFFKTHTNTNPKSELRNKWNMSLHINNTHVNLHAFSYLHGYFNCGQNRHNFRQNDGYFSYGQDRHNFKQIDVGDFLGWLVKILYLCHFTLTNASVFRINTEYPFGNNLFSWNWKLLVESIADKCKS